MKVIKHHGPSVPNAHLPRIVDEFFGDESWGPFNLFPYSVESQSRSQSRRPAVDITEDDREVVITASLPGYKPDEVEVEIDGSTLVIKGQVRTDQESNNKNYHRREISCGQIYREFTLPAYVDSTKAKATHKDGLLAITLPKKEDAKPKKLKVEVK